MSTKEGFNRWNSQEEVDNQTPSLVGYNLFETDRALVDAVKRGGAAEFLKNLSQFGKKLGEAEFIHQAFQANENPPQFYSHTRTGGRVDFIEFHPSWHKIIGESVKNGLHCSPWKDSKKGSHVARAAMFMLAYQNESGHCCPIAMTYGSIPVLKREPHIFKKWSLKLFSCEYDSSFLPMEKKSGILIGMAMTEKQGGSDVRANTTIAKLIKSSTKEYLITGHKWFCSAPMCDAFLTLAQTSTGCSCFLVPRFTPDQKYNSIFIQRLKNKLGDKSNASSEIEFTKAWGQLIGEEGKGISVIIEMVNSTRLDCMLSAAALMRQATVQAIHHSRHRSAFGKKLLDQALMKNVLADLCIESEATTLFSMRLAEAFDSEDKKEDHLKRLAVAVGKYYLTKRSISVVAEALEVLGGNGYTEDFSLARMYRQAPLNSIWEGSGNVICLDVLRAMAKDQNSQEIFLEEVKLACGIHKHFDIFVKNLETELSQIKTFEASARYLVEKLALALQGSLMIRYASQEAAQGFCSSRLTEESGRINFGTLPRDLLFEKIIDRF